eukprot:7217179-Pyramimonas_sp.AAC.1
MSPWQNPQHCVILQCLQLNPASPERPPQARDLHVGDAVVQEDVHRVPQRVVDRLVNAPEVLVLHDAACNDFEAQA